MLIKQRRLRPIPPNHAPHRIIIRIPIPHTMPPKELSQLIIPPLQHAQYLRMIPTVHGDALDVRGLDAEAAMTARAREAEGGAVGDAGPGGVGGAAVDAVGVAGEGAEEGEACGGEGAGWVDVSRA